MTTKSKKSLWPYKTVAVRPDDYEKFMALAEANRRNIVGQFGAMVELAERQAKTKPAPAKAKHDEKPPAD